MFTKHQKAETKKILIFRNIYEVFSVEETQRLKTLVHLDTNNIEKQILTPCSTFLIICMRKDGTRVSIDSHDSKE